MGKLADAIKQRRRRRQRPLGFGAAREEQRRTQLIAAPGPLPEADICLIESADDAAACGETALWGVPADGLDAEARKAAAEAGAACIVVSSTEADASKLLLEPGVDLVLRLDAEHSDEELDALATLRPALTVVPNPEFPLSVPAVAGLRRIATRIGAPLGAMLGEDVSDADLELLRDSAVAGLMLSPGASAEDAAELARRLEALPERKREERPDAPALVPQVGDPDDDEMD